MSENLDPSFAGEGIYREFILDHYRNPRNSGSLENPTFSHKEFNPLCGDEITFHVRLDHDSIDSVSFQGKGCAISQASASLLSQSLEGKTLSEIKSLRKESVLEMLGIPIGPVRIKCAMLSLVTLKNGIAIYEESYGRS